MVHMLKFFIPFVGALAWKMLLLPRAMTSSAMVMARNILFNIFSYAGIIY